MIMFHKARNENSVKGANCFAKGSSLGREDNAPQVEPDRQQITAAIRNKNKKMTRPTKIATWNVRTLLQKGKLANVIQEMKRMNIDILGISEMRWNESGRLRTTDNYTVIFSGNNNHSNGVGFILAPNVASKISGYWAVSDRVILVKLKNTKINTSIIQAYAPTSEASDEKLAEFYQDLEKAKKICKFNELCIVMGDFNAIVGNELTNNVTGKFGLGTRNERGSTLVEWCQMHDFLIANTCFQQHPRRLVTWNSPDKRTRNQIDFIMVPLRFRSSVLNVKTYPGADCNSDHNPVVSRIRLRLKTTKKPNSKWRPDYTTCKSEEKRIELQKTTKRNMLLHQKETSSENQAMQLEEEFRIFSHAVQLATEKHVPNKEIQKHKPWMTQEILDKMEERRQHKNNTLEYSKLNHEIKKMCYTAQEKHLNEECRTIEQRLNINPKEVHQRISRLTGKYKTNKSSCLKAKSGEILMEHHEMAKRWAEYLHELYDDPERNEKPFIFNPPLSGPDITKHEIEDALKHIKLNKATGPDKIATEVLLALEGFGIEILHKLFNNIYNTGTFPKEMMRSIFIALPKKPSAIECEDYRTISLMSHITKILLRIIMKRMRAKIHPEIGEEQFGFMPDKGTRNAVFVLKNIIERTIEMQQDVFLCFLDYKKAFDRVKHIDLLKMLHRVGIDDKDLQLIQNIYFEQSAAICLGDEMSEWINIKKGVRQGCVLSPDLFSLYSEVILREIDDEEGIKVGGVNINNLRFADDTVLLADSKQKLQNLVDIINEKSIEKGMQLNEKKTVCMVTSKKTKAQDKPGCNISVNNQILKQVESFKYLGTTLAWDGRDEKEIRIRIAQAKDTFNKMKNILRNKNISFQTRFRVLRCYVYPVLMYNSETWTISKLMAEKLQAFEMWCYRRMQRISWTAHMTNENVLHQIQQERSLMKEITMRQMKFLGHSIRKQGLEQLAVSGRINGRRARGRQRKTYLQQFSSTGHCLLQCAYDRKLWGSLIDRAVNAWNRQDT